MRLWARQGDQLEQAGEAKERYTPALVPAGILCLVATVAFPPLIVSLVGGVLAGLLLRRLHLHWSWGLAVFLLSAMVLLAKGTSAGAELSQMRKALFTSGGSLSVTPQLSAFANYWDVVFLWSLPVGGLVASAVKRWFDQRDRLRGGKAQRQVEHTPTPVAATRRAIDRVREGFDDDAAWERGIHLGTDPRGAPVRIAWEALDHHYMLLGASGQGKTNTALTIAEGTLEAGWAQLILDLSGDPEVAERARLLAKLHDRPFWCWSLDEPPWQELARTRCACNFLAYGTVGERRDLLLSTLAPGNPSRDSSALDQVLRLALDAHDLTGQPATFSSMSKLLWPEELKKALREADARRYREELAWLDELATHDEYALAELRRRIAGCLRSQAGPWMVPRTHYPVMNLHGVLKERGVAVFSIDATSHAELGQLVAEFVTQSVAAVCGQLQRAGQHTEAELLIDDVGNVETNQLPLLLDRAHSVGIRVGLVGQSISSLVACGGQELANSVVDNSGFAATHRLGVSDGEELLTSLRRSYEPHEGAASLNGSRPGLQPQPAQLPRASGLGEVKTLSRGEVTTWLKYPKPWSATVQLDRLPSLERLRVMTEQRQDLAGTRLNSTRILSKSSESFR
jgi:hypothetical protein